MNDDSRAPFADAHERASSAFRSLSREEKLQRMRDAGVLGLTPHVGDKVRVRGPLMTWHYGIVVGVDGAGRVNVVHNDKIAGVVHATLAEFAGRQAVQMVQRAPENRAYEVAARAVNHLGKPYDLVNFNCEHLASDAQQGTATSPQLMLGGLLAVVGLAVAAVALSGDQSWDGNLGRYRDSRGRFA